MIRSQQFRLRACFLSLFYASSRRQQAATRINNNNKNHEAGTTNEVIFCHFIILFTSSRGAFFPGVRTMATADEELPTPAKDGKGQPSETTDADATPAQPPTPKQTPSRISFPLLSQIIHNMSPKSKGDTSPAPAWMDEKSDVKTAAAISPTGETTPLIGKQAKTEAAAGDADSTNNNTAAVVTEAVESMPYYPTPIQPPTMEPTKPWFLQFVHLLQTFTSIVTTVLISLEILAFFYLPMTLLENFLCGYLIAFGILVIMTETNIWGLGDRLNKLLNFWFIRGAFYVFIGIQGLNQLANAVMRIDAGIEWSRMFYRNMITIVSWLMIGIGILYFCMGVLCLHILYDKQNAKYKTNIKEWKSDNNRYVPNH